MRPLKITRRTLLAFSMSSSGLPWTSTISASLPGSMVPASRSEQLRRIHRRGAQRLIRRHAELDIREDLGMQEHAFGLVGAGGDMECPHAAHPSPPCRCRYPWPAGMVRICCSKFLISSLSQGGSITRRGSFFAPDAPREDRACRRNTVGVQVMCPPADDLDHVFIGVIVGLLGRVAAPAGAARYAPTLSIPS